MTNNPKQQFSGIYPSLMQEIDERINYFLNDVHLDSNYYLNESYIEGYLDSLNWIKELLKNKEKESCKHKNI